MNWKLQLVEANHFGPSKLSYNSKTIVLEWV